MPLVSLFLLLLMLLLISVQPDLEEPLRKACMVLAAGALMRALFLVAQAFLQGSTKHGN